MPQIAQQDYINVPYVVDEETDDLIESTKQQLRDLYDRGTILDAVLVKEYTEEVEVPSEDEEEEPKYVTKVVGRSYSHVIGAQKREQTEDTDATWVIAIYDIEEGARVFEILPPEPEEDEGE